MEQNTWFVIKPEEGDLVHHGIRNQRWYVRRYQNPDGSLTPLGRIRYGIGKVRDRVRNRNSDSNSSNNSGESNSSNRGESSTSSGSNSQSTSNATRQSPGSTNTSNTQSNNSSSQQSSSNTTGNPSNNSNNRQSPGNTNTSNTQNSSPSNTAISPRSEGELATLRSQQSKALSSGSNMAGKLSNIAGKLADKEVNRVKSRMDLSAYSNQDLQNYITRMNLENQVKNLSTANVGSGKRALQTTLDIAGSVLAVGASAASIAAVIHEIRKGR